MFKSNTMKRLTLIACAVLMALMASAQPFMGPPPGMRPGQGQKQMSPEERREARMARMYEKLKTELNMEKEQAEKFAPIYQQYQRDINATQKELKTYLDSYKDQTIDDKAAYNMLKAQLDNELDIVKIKREYIKIFKNYLTPEQLSKVFLAEKARPKRPGMGHGPQVPPEGAPAAPQGPKPE